LVNLIEAGDTHADGNLKITIDSANNQLTKEINRKEWVAELKKLLAKRKSELPFSEYHGDGNHLLAKEKLENAIVNFRKIFGV